MKACFAVPYGLAVTLAALITLPQLSAISVWINEFHYDNSGGDVGEFVEIAGAAGTDLIGYTISLYNGSNGASYNTINLSSVIPNQLNGFGTHLVSFPANGIQNGAPDGLALSSISDGLLQFLSYEGSFTAVGGAADGVASTDVGLSETNSTPVGQSLQLTGFGTTYSDFSWTGPASASPGALNANQSFPQLTSSAPGTSVPDNGASGALLTLALSGLLIIRRMIS